MISTTRGAHVRSRSALIALVGLTAPFLSAPATAQPLQPNSTVEPVIPEQIHPADIDAGDVPRETNEAVTIAEAPQVRIAEIRFVGDGVPPQVAQAAGRYVGEYATVETLKALAADMTDAFGKSSVPLFTFSIPKQDLSKGVVRILVAEGYVGALVLKGESESGAAPLARKMASRIVDRRPLPRDDYERALLLVRQIPGLEVKSGLSRLDAPKAVALAMDLDTSRPTIGFGFETRGPRYANDGIVKADANIYSVLRAGDRTRLTLSGTVEDDALRYGSLYHDTPIGSDGLRASLSGALIRTRSGRIEGEASSVALGLSYPIILTVRNQLNASLSLDRLDSSNAFLGSTIAAEKNWTLRASLSGQIIRDRTSVGGRVTLAKGLDIFDAEVSPFVGETAFTYVDALAVANQRVGDHVVLRAAAKGRWTRDTLPAAERFRLGGEQYGRAFDDAALSGDRGYGAYAEAAFRPFAKGDFARSEVYGFIDEGTATILDRPLFARRSFSLGSWGAGVRIAWKDKAKLGLEASRVRHAPAPLRDDDWQVALSWSVDFRP